MGHDALPIVLKGCLKIYEYKLKNW